jgi:hypothetical protein
VTATNQTLRRSQSAGTKFPPDVTIIEIAITRIVPLMKGVGHGIVTSGVDGAE